MMEVVWFEEALHYLKEMSRYFAGDDPAAAYRVLAKREATTDSLQHHLQLGHPERVPKTRELVVSSFPYIIPYYVKCQEFPIPAVMHTSCKWPEEF